MKQLLHWLIFEENAESAHMERSLGWLKSISTTAAWWLAVALLIFAVLFLLFTLFYHPKMRRGSLWVSRFGLFAGAPKLYMHRRPASFCGLSFRTHRKAGH